MIPPPMTIILLGTSCRAIAPVLVMTFFSSISSPGKGVVSLPHGWGHGTPGSRMRVAAENAGVPSNVLTDDRVIDTASGNGVLNGIPVEVAAA